MDGANWSVTGGVPSSAEITAILEGLGLPPSAASAAAAVASSMGAAPPPLQQHPQPPLGMRPSGSPKTTLSASSSYANLAAAGGGGESGGGGGFPAASSRKRRFMWTAALHERFIAAVFDIGLRTCTPLSVFDAMGEGAEDGGDGGVRGADLAPEHVKSHLQKYRNNHRLGRTAFLRGFAEAQTAARLTRTATRSARSFGGTLTRGWRPKR